MQSFLGDTEGFDRFSRRTVKVTKEHNDVRKRLLKLMGVLYVEAPCETEAQCAALAKAGKAYAAASEDCGVKIRETLTYVKWHQFIRCYLAANTGVALRNQTVTYTNGGCRISKSRWYGD
ncbi:hypothetical protein SeLEV6574_g04020 [Synchytrium endobioticum]|uniref:XPG-I domain-containing protein n=1 Tax=Synchytrium endobioticum TaxID=286115 RepID=A0A507D1L2_9FUNG|nr:hypothetical protein SeLEV6574_g04020 [Synchytrium endobioticum]